MPVAANCWLTATTTLGLGGVTLMETRTAFVTVSEVLPDTVPTDADIVVVPTATDVTRPFEPAALLTAATVVLDDFQVAAAVSTCLVLSE